MGSVGSKSPLERRNTVARRSQRRTLHNLKPKVEQLHKNIKKFKGVTEDVNYVALKNDIEYFKNDLTRRGKDLQPQVRQLYETIYKRICEAEEALQSKLEENKEKQDKKEATSKESEIAPSEVLSEATSTDGDNETVAQVHEEDKRQTVEVKLFKIANEEATAKSPKEVRIVTPAEKRKSILKMGVPVMPGAIMNDISNQVFRSMSQEHKPAAPPSARTVQDVVARIGAMIKELQQIEEDINNFVGKKNGKLYNKMRDNLNKYLVELNGLSPVDDYALEKMLGCRTYISSCLSFLDEKATPERPESFTSDDEVFENNNVPLKKVEENFRLQKLLKNTAV